MKTLIHSNIFTDEGYKKYLLVENEKISYVGNKNIKFYDRLINLKDYFIYPSFFDSHTHIIWYGLNISRCDLSNVRDQDEIIQRIRDYISKNPQIKVVIAEGYDETKFTKNFLPSRKFLDLHFKDKPVILRRICGHIAVFNTEGLKFVKGYIKDFPKDGVIKEGIVLKLNTLFKPDREELVKSFKKAQEIFLSYGITSISEMATSDALELFEEIDPILDIHFYFPWEFEKKLSGWKDKKNIRLKGLKVFVDGSIGAYTAALYGRYDNKKSGKIFIGKETFKKIITIAMKKGYQLAIHSIGDRSTDFVLNNLPEKSNHRIEHFEITNQEQIKRVKRMGLFLSMQPNFIGNWALKGQMYEKRLPDKYYKFNNVFKVIVKENIPLGLGSDCMPPSPMYGINSLSIAQFQSQRLDFYEGLKFYTYGSAFINGVENIVGKIKENYKADFIVMDKRIEEKNVKILKTFKNGVEVYKSKKERI